MNLELLKTLAQNAGSIPESVHESSKYDFALTQLLRVFFPDYQGDEPGFEDFQDAMRGFVSIALSCAEEGKDSRPVLQGVAEWAERVREGAALRHASSLAKEDLEAEEEADRKARALDVLAKGETPFLVIVPAKGRDGKVVELNQGMLFCRDQAKSLALAVKGRIHETTF